MFQGHQGIEKTRCLASQSIYWHSNSTLKMCEISSYNNLILKNKELCMKNLMFWG